MIDLAFFVLSSTSIKTELNIISPFSTGFILLLLPLKNLLIDASLSIPKILFFPPTIPRSETNPVPCGKTLLSAVATWVWVPTNAVILPSRYYAKAAFSDVASACKSIKIGTFGSSFSIEDIDSNGDSISPIHTEPIKLITANSLLKKTPVPGLFLG